MEEKRIHRAYWRGEELVVESSQGTFTLESGDGIKALKANRVSLPGNLGGGEAPMFVGDTSRRMALIQERISGPRD